MSATNVAKLRDWFEKKVVENHRLYDSIDTNPLQDEQSTTGEWRSAARAIGSNNSEIAQAKRIVGHKEIIA